MLEWSRDRLKLWRLSCTFLLVLLDLFHEHVQGAGSILLADLGLHELESGLEPSVLFSEEVCLDSWLEGCRVQIFFRLLRLDWHHLLDLLGVGILLLGGELCEHDILDWGVGWTFTVDLLSNQIFYVRWLRSEVFCVDRQRIASVCRVAAVIVCSFGFGLINAD